MKKFLIIFALICGANAAEIGVSKVIAPIYNDATSKDIVGKFLPTNSFKILSQKGNRLKIEIVGYQNPKAKSALYYVSGKRILVAGFTKHANFKPKKLGVKDGWTKLKYVVYIDIDPKNMVKGKGAMETVYKEAHALFQGRCSMCHSLPAANHFSANQWPSLVNAMKSRAGLTKDQQFLIAEYQQKHAKDMVGH